MIAFWLGLGLLNPSGEPAEPPAPPPVVVEPSSVGPLWNARAAISRKKRDDDKKREEEDARLKKLIVAEARQQAEYADALGEWDASLKAHLDREAARYAAKPEIQIDIQAIAAEIVATLAEAEQQERIKRRKRDEEDFLFLVASL